MLFALFCSVLMYCPIPFRTLKQTVLIRWGGARCRSVEDMKP